MNTVQLSPILSDILDKPECNIQQGEDDGQIVLTCESSANPEDVMFHWTRINETFGDDDVTVDGLSSYITVDAVEASFGVYYCHVKNSMGPGLPCEIDVKGKPK